MAFSIEDLKPYIAPILATIAMIFFAVIYESPVPFWWVFSFITILFGYSYLYWRSQK